MTVADVCDVAYAALVEQFEGDGRAAVARGDERPPQSFRDMVDEILAEQGAPTGRIVGREERELREALGVA